MPIPVVCLSCFANLRAPDNTPGRTVKCPKCGRAVVVPMPGSEPSQSTRAAPATDPRAKFGLVQQPTETPPPLQTHLPALDELEADRPRRGRRRLRNDNDDQLDRDQYRGIGRDRKRKRLIVALAVGGGLSLVGLAVVLGVMFTGIGSTASRQNVEDITRQNQELLAKLEKTEAEAREKRTKEEADAKTKDDKAKRDAEEQAARKLAEEKEIAAARAEAERKSAPPTSAGETTGRSKITSVATLMEGLTDAEKKYATDYIKTGKPKIPMIYLGPEPSERSLAELRTGEYGTLTFIAGMEVRQVINKREFLACGRGAPQRALGDFWVEGVSTADLVDGGFASLDKIPLVVVGTKTYRTTLGGSRTVKHFVVFDTKKLDRLVERYFAERKAEHEALAKKREAEEAKRRAEEQAADARRDAEREKADRAAAPLFSEAKKLYENEATREKGKKALEEVASKYPGTKTAIEARDLLAAPLLREAKKLLAGEKTVEKGRVGLRDVVRLYPDTESGKEARKLLNIEEAKQEPDPKAEPYLRSAKKLLERDMREKAKQRLKELIAEFPVSKTTEDARKLLEQIEEDDKFFKKTDK